MSDSSAPRPLRRSTRGGMIGGVASGLGAYFRIDPIIVRIAFVASLFAGGIGIVAYLAAWLLVPDDAGRSAFGGARLPWAGEDATRVGGMVLIFLAALLILGEWSWTSEIVIPLLLIGAGVWLLLRPRDAGTDVDEPPATSSPEDIPGEPTPVPVSPSSPDPAPTTAAPTTMAPPAPVPPPAAPPPSDPPSGLPVARLTYAIVFLVAGGFGLAIAGGADVDARTLFLSCLAVTGVGLLVGSFLGRSRSLIPLGIMLLAGTSITSALELSLDGGVGERMVEPASVASVDDEYELGVGEMVIDLTELPPGELRHRRIEIDASVGIGSLWVVVPEDMAVAGTLDSRLGEVRAFDRTEEGADAALDVDRAGEDDAGTVVLDLRVAIGEVIVE